MITLIRMISSWYVCTQLCFACLAQPGINTTNNESGLLLKDVPAISHSLDSPIAVTLDSSGGFYVADRNRIYHVLADGRLRLVAGNGINGYSGDGGIATSAQLNGPMSVAVDSAGNLFIADTANNRIRKITLDGIINTIAGNGVEGYSGDEGPATSAQIKGPHGITVDFAGNLFIADSFNHCIRKIDSNGVITTVAGNGTYGYFGDGGPAISAQLRVPHDVAVDSAGNLYIADTDNYCIRKVTPDGIITTVAGNGAASYDRDSSLASPAWIDDPRSIALDSAGNLYFADTGKHRIRKVDPDGVITTVAGNGTYGYSGDGDPAISAQLYAPFDAAVDSSGNLYIADWENNRIRKVDSDGVITTVAGNGAKSYSGDDGPAISAQLYSPTDVAVDPDGNLYIADAENNCIRKVDPDGVITTVTGNGTRSYSGDGGPASSARLASPRGVAVDSSGNLYIADMENHRIRKVDSNGVITTMAGNGSRGYNGDGGPAISAQLSYPEDVAVDSSGNLYIADSGNKCIRKVTLDGLITTFDLYSYKLTASVEGVVVSTRLDSPRGIAVDSSGNLYISYLHSNLIHKVTPDRVVTTFVGNGTRGYSGDGGQATSAQLFLPAGIAVDSAGNLYIADTNNYRIRKVTPGGVITTVVGNGTRGYNGDGGQATSAQLTLLGSVTLDSAGNLYITDFNRIRKITPNGVITTVAGN